MSSKSSFIGIYKDNVGNAIIGVCNGLIQSGLDLKYYNANTGVEYTGAVETCCNGFFDKRVRGMSCNSVLIGVFVDGSDNPLFAKFDGIQNSLAVLTYYDATTGNVFVGTVYICCSSSGGVDISHLTVTAVAGSAITDAGLTGTAYLICWNNMCATGGWTQIGTTVTFTDGTIFAGGETVKILMY